MHGPALAPCEQEECVEEGTNLVAAHVGFWIIAAVKEFAAQGVGWC